MKPLFTTDGTTMRVLGSLFAVFSLDEIGLSGDWCLYEERLGRPGLEG